VIGPGFLVPGVEFDLQAVALGEQRDVLRCARSLDDGVEALPEDVAGHAAGGQDLVFDETVELGRDLESVGGSAGSHVFSPGAQYKKIGMQNECEIRPEEPGHVGPEEWVSQ
jgi:hypothetical protein